MLEKIVVLISILDEIFEESFGRPKLIFAARTPMVG